MVAFEIIKVALALAAGAFVYFRFFREGTHRQRIEFDLDLVDLGVAQGERIVEIGSIAENKGFVEQRFDDIRVSIRAIEDGAPLEEIAGHAPRLAFPIKVAKASLISDNWQYYFVRPGVKQRFPLVLRLPEKCTHVHARATFKYQGTKNVHSAERAWSLTKKVC